MTEIIIFTLQQIFTKSFWFFVACTFLGVILLTFRNTFRSDIFKAASEWNRKGKPTTW